jgi:hypothetical protein
MRYTAFGEVRISSGETPTDYRYTGQLESEIGWNRIPFKMSLLPSGKYSLFGIIYPEGNQSTR